MFSKKEKLLFVFGAFFVLGIYLFTNSSVLPEKVAKLEDFLITDEQVIVKNINQKTQTDFDSEIAKFTFVSENFAMPESGTTKNCDWKKLSRIVDGDTIIVDENERVRFIGIDTPETKDPRKSLDLRGLDSSKKLKELLKNTQKICLIYDTEGDKLDKYKRTLAYVFTEEGIDVNAEMLRTGWAKGYFYFPFERKEEFRVYEKFARISEVGLWEK